MIQLSSLKRLVITKFYPWETTITSLSHLSFIDNQIVLPLLHIFRNPTPKFDPLLGVIWNPVTKDGLRYLNIDKELTMQKDLLKDRMAFWEELKSSL